MSNHVILNNVEHQNLRVITDRSAALGDSIMGVPILPSEFRDAQHDFPIFFHKDAQDEKLEPYAIFGLEQDENLFLDGGNWNADYVPLLLEKGPFLIGLQEKSGGEKELVISLDLDHPRVSETEGEPLFLPQGGNSTLVERISRVLHRIHEGQRETEPFVAAMLRHELLEPFALNIELDDGSKHRLEGFHTIHEENLMQLDGETLSELSRSGYLQAAYMVVASLSNIRKLIKWKNQRLVA